MYWRTDFWMTAGFLSETVKFLSVEEVAQLIKNLPAMQEISCNAGDLGSIPGSGRSPQKGNGNPL